MGAHTFYFLLLRTVHLLALNFQGACIPVLASVMFSTCQEKALQHTLKI